MVFNQSKRKMYASLVGREVRLRRMKHVVVSPIGRQVWSNVNEPIVHINLPSGVKGTIVKVVLGPEPKTYVEFSFPDDLQIACWVEKEFLEVLSENRGDQ
jgi:hypothetical protein